MKSFVFLYPIPQIMDFEIKNLILSQKEKNKFREEYKDALNKCIDLRYRKKGFGINYAIFDDCKISDVVEVNPLDNIFNVGLYFKTHTEKKVYPSQDYILKQLGNVNALVVAGFHIWDCVEKLAEVAYKKGIDVLVDEDLTEFFTIRLKDKGFDLRKYPSFNPREKGDSFFESFMEARKNKPWFWQDY